MFKCNHCGRIFLLPETSIIYKGTWCPNCWSDSYRRVADDRDLSYLKAYCKELDPDRTLSLFTYIF